jgi:hypothetical protein
VGFLLLAITACLQCYKVMTTNKDKELEKNPNKLFILNANLYIGFSKKKVKSVQHWFKSSTFFDKRKIVLVLIFGLFC